MELSPKQWRLFGVCGLLSLMWAHNLCAKTVLYGTYPYRATQSFLAPFPQLSPSQKPHFYAGRALATQPWIEAPASTTARDGLGPLYNARRCTDCHPKGLRGLLPSVSQPIIKLPVVKLGDVPSASQSASFYGDQIQTQAIGMAAFFKNVPFKSTPLDNNSLSDGLMPEAKLTLEWIEVPFKYPDGHLINLRKPTVLIDFTAPSAPPKNVSLSLRNAPIMYGTGLLQRIAEPDILAQEDVQDNNKDGISGKVNLVDDSVGQDKVIGRFGWKARHASVKQTVAAAFAQDIGIRSDFFPLGPCSELQMECIKQQQRSHPNIEITDELLALTDFFVRHIAVPASSQNKMQANFGANLFEQAQCAACHRPQWMIPVDEVSKATIWPYSDLLLHDMGEGLADTRREYLAQGDEWRTPPLWGLGKDPNLTKQQGNLLHDGRARSLEEAILWHSGEAEQAKNRFIHFSPEQRQALITFLMGL